MSPPQSGRAGRRLRRKLGDAAADSRYIITEPWVGYRMAGGGGDGGVNAAKN